MRAARRDYGTIGPCPGELGVPGFVGTPGGVPGRVPGLGGVGVGVLGIGAVGRALGVMLGTGAPPASKSGVLGIGLGTPPASTP
jgi:hypothetical protein